MDYIEALEWIHSRLTFGSRPGLQRVEALLNKIDNPQHKIKTIHIGGTNGKGSTVSFLRSLLEEEGLRVGTFTSPYITVFNERIAINNQSIPDQELVALVEKFKPLVAEMDQDEALAGVTEFEIITAMMFDYFYQQSVDVAIVEVGLGGLLDSTNVMTPLISGITTIGLDHMDILGNTLVEIAEQKAGIIKAQRPVVIGNVRSEALAVITKKTTELNSPLSQFAKDYQVFNEKICEASGERFTFSNDFIELAGLNISLLGNHQIENAAMAIELYCQLADQFGYAVSEVAIRKGLENARWAGRMEMISQEPLVLIDGAHNQPAIQVLVDNLIEEFAGRKIYTIFAAIRTKDVTKMLDVLGQVPNQELFVTTFIYPKAYQLEEYPLTEFATIQLMPDWQTGIKHIKAQMATDDVLLITGSLYFISQVRTFLLGGNDDN